MHRTANSDMLAFERRLMGAILCACSGIGLGSIYVLLTWLCVV